MRDFIPIDVLIATRNSAKQSMKHGGEIEHSVIYNTTHELLIAREILERHGLTKEFEEQFPLVPIEAETK